MYITEIFQEEHDCLEAGLLTRWVVAINGQGLSFTVKQPTKADAKNFQKLYEEKLARPKLETVEK